MRQTADVIGDIEGHAQHLAFRRGDLNVYANDDVGIAAERIKMNG